MKNVHIKIPEINFDLDEEKYKSSSFICQCCLINDLETVLTLPLELISGKLSLNEKYFTFHYGKTLQNAISIVILKNTTEENENSEEICRVLIPLHWFSKNSVTTDVFPLTDIKNFTEFGELKAKIHINENDSKPFEANPAKLLVRVKPNKPPKVLPLITESALLSGPSKPNYQNVQNIQQRQQNVQTIQQNPSQDPYIYHNTQPYATTALPQDKYNYPPPPPGAYPYELSQQRPVTTASPPPGAYPYVPPVVTVAPPPPVTTTPPPPGAFSYAPPPPGAVYPYPPPPISRAMPPPGAVYHYPPPQPVTTTPPPPGAYAAHPIAQPRLPPGVYPYPPPPGAFMPPPPPVGYPYQYPPPGAYPYPYPPQFSGYPAPYNSPQQETHKKSKKAKHKKSHTSEVQNN